MAARCVSRSLSLEMAVTSRVRYSVSRSAAGPLVGARSGIALRARMRGRLAGFIAYGTTPAVRAQRVRQGALLSPRG